MLLLRNQAMGAMVVAMSLIVSLNGQTTLCPTGWKRFINKCYKVIFHPPLGTHEEVVNACEAEDKSAKLALPKTARINDQVASMLGDSAGGGVSFIGLRDVLREGLYIWDDRFFQNSTTIDSAEFQAIVDKLKADNTELLDCVEITTTGTWRPVDCSGIPSRTHTVCMKHILKPTSGHMICGLNGELLLD